MGPLRTWDKHLDRELTQLLSLLAGPRVQRFHGAKKRAKALAALAAKGGIVVGMLKSARDCRSLSNFATLVELVEAFEIERVNWRRRELLLTLIRKIHHRSLRAMTYKISQQICSKSPSASADDRPARRVGLPSDR
jgi:hypothetical protein